jgi:hypothetical protein
MKKLSKDELKIVWWLVSEYKYDIYEAYKGNDRKGIIKAMDILEERLLELSYDKRREGRKSFNHFNDCLNRFIKKSLNQK